MDLPASTYIRALAAKGDIPNYIRKDSGYDGSSPGDTLTGTPSSNSTASFLSLTTSSTTSIQSNNNNSSNSTNTTTNSLASSFFSSIGTGTGLTTRYSRRLDRNGQSSPSPPVLTSLSLFGADGEVKKPRPSTAHVTGSASMSGRSVSSSVSAMPSGPATAPPPQTSAITSKNDSITTTPTPPTSRPRPSTAYTPRPHISKPMPPPTSRSPLPQTRPQSPPHLTIPPTLRKTNALSALLGGAISYLESCPGVTDVKMCTRPPVTTADVQKWEEREERKLPDDLRGLLGMTDGMSVQWSVRFPKWGGIPGVGGGNAEGMVLGCVHVNPLDRLVRVDTSSTPSRDWRGYRSGDGPTPSDETESLELPPTLHQLPQNHHHFPPPPRKAGKIPPTLKGLPHPPGPAYLLHDTLLHGKICLCFPPNTTPSPPTVWFQDPFGAWYPLSPTFTSFFRLMVLHLGIQGWHLSMTEPGAPASLDWIGFYSAERAALVRRVRSLRVGVRRGIQEEEEEPGDEAGGGWELERTLGVVKGLVGKKEERIRPANEKATTLTTAVPSTVAARGVLGRRAMTAPATRK
ncbi:Tubulin polyglutamylase complex subunit 2 [Phlyctochytrium planicorne]|nr:Tubulin polyglutamylase complex subunit 2 [Phlyctochytrium planicorne]